jgi:hypothetical protein
MTEHIPKFSWGKKKSEHEEASSPPIVSFVEIMSEALANELQEVCFEIRVYLPYLRPMLLFLKFRRICSNLIKSKKL